MKKINPKQESLLSVLIALNAWEQKNCPSLQTQSGRYLYFQLAKSLLASHEGKGGLIKQMVGDASERSIRDHMRSFQEADLLTEKSGTQDARTKQIVPTEKFTEGLRQHLDLCIGLLEDRYLMVEK
jgi:hypothetical protein